MANQGVRHNSPFCIVLQNDKSFMFSRSEGLQCTPLYAHVIYEKLTRIGDIEDLLEDIDIDGVAMTDEMDIDRYKTTEDLKQAIYHSLRDYERREHEHQMDVGQGLIKDPVGLIAELGSFYLNSYRGNNETVADGAFHNQLHRVSWWKLPLDFPTSEMLRQLEFRLNQMSTADEYLKIMEIPAPCGHSCAEFDMYKHKYVHRTFRYGEHYQAVLRRQILFPIPVDEEQGRPFDKGFEYVAAAFELAQVPIKVVNQKLDSLIAILNPMLESFKEFLLKDPGFRAKRRRAYDACGIALEEVMDCQDDIQCCPSTDLKRKLEDEFEGVSRVTKRKIEYH